MRPRRRRSLAGVLLALALPVGASAQDAAGQGVSGRGASSRDVSVGGLAHRPYPVPVREAVGETAGAQDELAGLATRLGGAWARRDAAAVAEWLAGDGVSLHLEGAAHPALGLRQARAALAEFLKEGGPGSVRVVRAEALGADHPTAGLVELAWSPSADAIPTPAPYAVFVALERRAEGWRATEIRVIR